jgi:DNA polymerase-3 subunit delta'
MIGHEKNSSDLKKLYERGALSHGYIFYGPSMVGKRLAAEVFASYLSDGAAILTDMHVVRPGESGSIGIDAVREVRNFLWQKPNISPRRMLIIDDAERLTTEAQNALLKITEEPPASSFLILITSDGEGILPTITSRLPKIYFGTVPERTIAAWLLAEGVEKKKAADTAKRAMGKPGLAWRLLHDDAFQAQIALAEKLLKTPAAAQREVIKKIIEPDEFNFRAFLDRMVLVLAWQEALGAKASRWHKALELYDRETNFALNPRLQLEALLS